jgi:hypothetical protein
VFGLSVSTYAVCGAALLAVPWFVTYGETVVMAAFTALMIAQVVSETVLSNSWERLLTFIHMQRTYPGKGPALFGLERTGTRALRTAMSLSCVPGGITFVKYSGLLLAALWAERSLSSFGGALLAVEVFENVDYLWATFTEVWQPDAS